MGEAARSKPTVLFNPAKSPPLIVTSYVLPVTCATVIPALVPVTEKSLASTPVTSSLNVARNTRVSAVVNSAVGVFRVNDVVLGAMLSSV